MRPAEFCRIWVSQTSILPDTKFLDVAKTMASTMALRPPAQPENRFRVWSVRTGSQVTSDSIDHAGKGRSRDVVPNGSSWAIQRFQLQS